MVMLLRLTSLAISLSAAAALQWNQQFAAEIAQRNIESRSLDRHYTDPSPEARRAGGYAKRGIVIDSETGVGKPITTATVLDSLPYAEHCPKKGGRVCNDQGLCLPGEGSALMRCSCYHGWFGAACHLKHCPSVIRLTSLGTNQLDQRVVYPAGTGSDGGQSSPSDFMECSGHGHCHHQEALGPGGVHAGTCECVHPFFGEDCSQHYCPVFEGKVCNGQGSCNKRGHGAHSKQWAGTKTFEGLQGSCTCNWPYFGEACQLAHCPSARRDVLVAGRRQEWFHGTDYVECSGHGVCHHETGLAATDKQRELGFSWMTNQITGPAFSASAQQSGSWGFCECAEPWYGPECAYKRCPETREGVCNNQGQCVQRAMNPHSPQHDFNIGNCKCDFPWFGDACERKHCPGAQRVQQGPLPPPATNWLECAGHGKCHLDMTDPEPGVGHYAAGECECDPGWGLSMDCSRRQCPAHRGRLCNGQGYCVTGDGDNQMSSGTLTSNGQVQRGDRAVDMSTKSGISLGEHPWRGGAAPGTCVCRWPYHNGPNGACEHKMCPGSSPRIIGKNPSRTLYASDWQVCSGHGRCHHNTQDHIQVVVGSARRVYTQGIGESYRELTVGSTVIEDGFCECDQGWHGADCSRATCPTFNGTECNGQGWCDRTGVNPANGDGGRCMCKEPFFGPDCSWRHCPGYAPKFDPSNPPNRPLLHHADYYECHAGQKLPRGICKYDVAECHCNDGYHGTQCEFIRCPKHEGLMCSGEGTCQRSTGKCLCNAGHEGAACEHIQCPVSETKVCGGHGHCNQESGACVCDTHYFGFDCTRGNGFAAVDLP